jgi:sugar phosphate isomerase/epimerase
MGPVEAARFASAHAFDGLEIQSNVLDFWPGPGSERLLRELRAIGENEGLHYTFYGQAALNPAARTPESRHANAEMIKHAIAVAVALSSPLLSVHPGVVSELATLERHGRPYATSRFDRAQLLRNGWQQAVEVLGQWAELAADAGLLLTIENEVHVRHTAAPTAESLAAMIDAIGRPNVRVNFDTGHAFIGEGLQEELAVLRPHIGHLHLNDNRGNVSEHLPLGAGAADFPAIAPFLASVDAALVLEIYAPERPVEASLESHAYLTALFRHIVDT